MQGVDDEEEPGTGADSKETERVSNRADSSTVQRPGALGRAALLMACALAVTLAIARFAGATIPTAALVAAAIAVLSVVGAGVAFPSSGVFARPILGMAPDATAGRFALTFDD